MAEHDVELRLRAAAGELDARAPAFDVARLRTASPRRGRRGAVALVCVVLAAAAATPAAIPSLRQLFQVDAVSELGPLAPGVAPGFAGRSVPFDEARATTPFALRTIESLGAPDGARVRDDIAGGLVTVVYESGRVQLSQWRTDDIHARLAVVPGSGRARDVSIGALPGLWIEGTARGTFTLVGADGTVHRESFEVGDGILMWSDGGMTFLLQGVPSSDEATSRAAESAP